LSSTTSPTSRHRVPRHIARLVTWLVAPLVVDYFASRRLVVDNFAYAARLGVSARRVAHRSSLTTSSTPHDRVPRHVARLVAWLVVPLVVDYFAYAARPGASAHRAARHAARRVVCRQLLRLAQARRRPLRLRRASGCLGTSCGSTHGSSRRSSSTTPLRAGSSSTTLPTPRVWVPRHVAQLIAHRRLLHLHRATGCLGTSRGSSRGSLRRSSSTTSPTPLVRVPWHVARLVKRLIVDYIASRRLVVDYFASASRRLIVDYSASRRLVVDNSASRRLVVDYFASVARPSSLARRAARHTDHRAARRRLLRLCRASGCLGTSRGSSPVVNYFAYATRPGASARHAARHVARRAARRRLLRLA
jgi:hypothetical protein